VNVENIVKKLVYLDKYYETYDYLSRDVYISTNNIGSEIVSETFLSTSISQEHSRRFIDSSTKCCLFEIYIPANSPGLFVTPFSSFQNDEENSESSEYEILLPPTSKFIVKGKIGNVTRLHYVGPQQNFDLSRDQMDNIMKIFAYPHATSNEDIIKKFFL
jgi:hypothetical protein